jgi:hypothetical protein
MTVLKSFRFSADSVRTSFGDYADVPGALITGFMTNLRRANECCRLDYVGLEFAKRKRVHGNLPLIVDEFLAKLSEEHADSP